ncbi:MAG: signal recognition particle-docking protein FtsY, partial [Steroidobacteraceae bacterium]
MSSSPPDEELPVLTDIVELGPEVAATPVVPEPEPGPEPEPEPPFAAEPAPDPVLTRRALELVDEALEEALHEATVLLQERVRARLQRELPGL